MAAKDLLGNETAANKIANAIELAVHEKKHISEWRPGCAKVYLGGEPWEWGLDGQQGPNRLRENSCGRAVLKGHDFSRAADASNQRGL